MSKHARIWRINGEDREVKFFSLDRLLDVLRDRLGLLSLKEGCGEGECGTCSVMIDGEVRLACLTAAAQIDDGAELLTAEGIGGDKLGRQLVEAFDEGGAVQCGYCTPGVMVGSYALLGRNPDATVAEIREGLAGHLCRCTGYTKIVSSVARAGRGTEGEERA